MLIKWDKINLSFLTKLLLKSLLEARESNKFTPLMLASKKGFVNSMKVLLDHGANLYGVDNWKWTALHHGAFNI